jgi:uncharacterized protein
MARQKKGAKKAKKPSRRKKKPSLATNLKKILAGVSILFLLVVAAGITTYYLVPGEKAITPVATERIPIPSPKKQKQATYHKPDVVTQNHETPAYEIYPNTEAPPVRRESPVDADPLSGLPAIAIIIDDIGYNRVLAKKFIDLEADITLSVLPYSPFRKSILKAAKEKGVAVMLHLPMEPNEYPRVSPGQGALLNSMSPDQLIASLRKTLDNVPIALGVNNHMGSSLTENAPRMNQIFTVLKQRGLFFVDSRTTLKTRCRESARLLHVPFGQRDVFLDHIPEKGSVKKELERLVTIAVENGFAIGIGHPHAATYDVLREMLPAMKKRVQFVPVSRLVRTIS